MSFRSSTMARGFSGRASAMRRQRRRLANVGRLYCPTNGCASFLIVDPDGLTAACAICGFVRHIA
jgi:hypothetical protein